MEAEQVVGKIKDLLGDIPTMQFIQCPEVVKRAISSAISMADTIRVQLETEVNPAAIVDGTDRRTALIPAEKAHRIVPRDSTMYEHSRENLEDEQVACMHVTKMAIGQLNIAKKGDYMPNTLYCAGCSQERSIREFDFS